MKNSFLLLVLNLTICSFVFSQGLQLATQEQLEGYEVWVDDKRGFTGELPSSFTMEEYCPPVMTQTGNSCVGWSIYATISTMYNVLGNHTHPYQKLALAFDPYFIYVSLRKGYEEDCDEPMYMKDAMEFLLDHGNKRWGLDPYYACKSKVDADKFNSTKWVAQPFAVNNIYIIESINDIKECVVDYQPVMTGVEYGESMGPLGAPGGTVGSDGLWRPNNNDKEVGGHAITVVGYDDYKFGGAFRIMNSWGADYGDDGFIWIKYSDFEIVANEAYAIYPKLFKADKEELTIETSYYTRIEFESGNIYEGTYVDGQMHGQGCYIYENGNVFFTSFDEGEYDGYGLYFDIEEWKMIDFKHDKGALTSREERGFGSASKSELDTYLEIFSIDINKETADLDFELPETEKAPKKATTFNFNKTNNYNIKKTEIKESTTTDCPDCYGTLVTTYETEYCVGERCKNRTLYKCNYDSTHAYWIYHD